MNRLLNIRRDQRGVSSIELALFAPILATMVIGVVDMSNAFSRKLECEQAAQRAIEKVMQTTGTKTPADTIIDEASLQADIPDAEKATKVTVTYRLECDDDDPQLSSDATTFDTYECPDTTVNEARYIQVEINDVYEPMFPLHFASYSSGDGGYPIKATAGMRTQ